MHLHSCRALTRAGRGAPRCLPSPHPVPQVNGRRQSPAAGRLRVHAESGTAARLPQAAAAGSAPRLGAAAPLRAGPGPDGGRPRALAAERRSHWAPPATVPQQAASAFNQALAAGLRDAVPLATDPPAGESVSRGRVLRDRALPAAGAARADHTPARTRAALSNARTTVTQPAPLPGVHRNRHARGSPDNHAPVRHRRRDRHARCPRDRYTLLSVTITRAAAVTACQSRSAPP